jgi:hypothetical protein
MDELLLLICKIAGTGFFVFLLGFVSYSIVTHNKRRGLKEQRRREELEAARYESYFNKIDDDLKNEIDNASKKYQQQYSIDCDAANSTQKSWEDDYIKGKNDDIFLQLRANLHHILEKGFKFIENGEDKYRKYNAKYHFDDEYNTNLEKYKKKANKWMDKVMEYIDKL